MPQLTTTEQNLIDKLVRKEKKKPIEAWRAVNKYRAKTMGKSKKAKRLSPNTVYEYCKGEGCLGMGKLCSCGVEGIRIE